MENYICTRIYMNEKITTFAGTDDGNNTVAGSI